ncbi:MAG: phosphoglucomutase/phosphomannomutase family protein [Elusimicrobia bacterium]|nr:phosphoglucomutase/phosphomannomutase family protein [Elusimicrobiota bacterium]
MSSHPNQITFGTDGFRGIISKDFTYEAVRKIAQGLADYIAYKHMRVTEKPHVFVGYDRRFMSDRFAAAAAEILAANGITAVVSAEPLPTPAVSCLTVSKFGLGVVITASHNKYFYNGVKIKQNGRSAPPSVTAELENYISKAVPMPATGAPVVKRSFKQNYLDYLNSKARIGPLLSKLPGPVVIDFMYGTGAEVAGEIFNSKNIIKIRADCDPLFGGITPEPVEKNLAELIATVRKKGALMGMALDGDADRFALVDDKGQYMTPCQIAPLLLDYLLKRNVRKGKVAQAVSMGYLTRRIAKAAGLLFEETPVGFKYIAEKMISEDVFFGAEESGGYAWKGNIPERDGILTALMFLEMTMKTGKTASELYKDIETEYGKSFFIRKDARLEKAVPNKHSFAVKLKKKLPKTIIGRKVLDTNTIDGLKIILDNDSWLLMRPSGTEPLLRTYAETESRENTGKLLEFAVRLMEH